MGIVMKVNLNQMNKFQGQFFIKMDIYSQENFNKNIKTKYILLVYSLLLSLNRYLVFKIFCQAKEMLLGQ